jgi:hypothetical protein
MLVIVVIKAALFEKQYGETSGSTLSFFSGALLVHSSGDGR